MEMDLQQRIIFNKKYENNKKKKIQIILMLNNLKNLQPRLKNDKKWSWREMVNICDIQCQFNYFHFYINFK